MPTAASDSTFPIAVPASAAGWRRRARTRAAESGLVRVRVWDLPTRLFHWTLATAFLALVATGFAGGAWMEWHGRLGALVLVLLLFRLAWGFVGGHWSRFASFLPTPARLKEHLRGGEAAARHAGHSPLGAISVLAMLLVLLAQVGTGLLSDDGGGFTGPWNEHVPRATAVLATALHRQVGAWLLIALVLLHVGAIVYYRLARRRKLVQAMLDGDRLLQYPAPSSRDDARSRLLASVVIMLALVLVAWLVGF